MVSTWIRHSKTYSLINGKTFQTFKYGLNKIQKKTPQNPMMEYLLI